MTDEAMLVLKCWSSNGLVLDCNGSMSTLRNLKIKTSTCKRLVKELHSYEKEVEREAAKTADMKEKNADPYDLKQQVCLAVSSLVNKLFVGNVPIRVRGSGVL